MTINEIINGNGEFKGIIPLMNVYLASATNLSKNAQDVISKYPLHKLLVQITHMTFVRYLTLISKRASGELMTNASWMRQFVASHPEYKNDSVVSEQICLDLVTACSDIANNKRSEPLLFGNLL